MKFIENNVAAVEGFSALGKSIGIKKGKKDFAIIYASSPCTAAAVYTNNALKGAPLSVTMEHLKDHRAQAIVINSGVANVATGEEGIKDARMTASLASIELGIEEKDVIVASTGIIGKRLPMEKIRNGIKGCKKELDTVHDAALAILTTDTTLKEMAIEYDGFRIGCIAKGSGMIHPNLATMLCFVTTDADIEANDLQRCLREAANKSFNMISVDMDTSTSDMVVILSTNKKKTTIEKFQSALDFVCTQMAKKIAMDGEGATKLIEVTVQNAATKEDAKKAAKAVICSNLVKCAMYGNDPNWGRIMSAIGNSGAVFTQEKIMMTIQGQSIVERGIEAKTFDESQVSKALKGSKVKVVIDLDEQKGNDATAYGCDMSYGYVEINASYHT